MLKEKITFEDLKIAIDKISSKNKLQRNYQVIDLKKIKNHISTKNCLLFSSECSVILLDPIFDYYDLYIYFTDKQVLFNDIDTLKKLIEVSQNKIKKFRVSICDNKRFSNVDLYNDYLDFGFKISKRIARFNLSKNDNIMKTAYNMVPEEYRNADFANENDAEEILSLMQGEFDNAGDSIPELEEIRENINKKQVICVKYNSEIISFHYFEVINNIYYGLFDFTRKDFRQFFVFFVIDHFRSKYVKEVVKKDYSRLYGWRDEANKRTNKFAHQRKEAEDGVEICNLVLEFN